MSITAPWLAIAADWQDSEMFDPIPSIGMNAAASAGERLAWVLLLCAVKIKGRAGVVAFRKSALARDFKLSERAIEGMLKRAQKCKAVNIEGEFISVCNWRSYQDKAFKKSRLNGYQSGKSPELSTTDTKYTSPSTHHTSHIPPDGVTAFAEFWTRWPKHPRKSDRSKAETHWRSKGLDDCAADVMRGLDRWIASREWADQDRKFIPAPVVWLRGRRWEAEPTPLNADSLIVDGVKFVPGDFNDPIFNGGSDDRD